MNWIVFVLVFCAGIATAIQGGVNGNLGKKIGIIEAAFVSFLVGTIFLGILLVFMRKGNLSAALEVPKWQLTGGLLGAIYILIMVVAVPKIGVASAVMTLIIGQITSSVIIDHFGLVPEKHIPFNIYRATGVILMFAALLLFTRK